MAGERRDCGVGHVERLGLERRGVARGGSDAKRTRPV